MEHATKMLLETIVVPHLSGYTSCEGKSILPKYICDFRPQRMTVDTMFAVRTLKQQARAREIPLYARFVDLHGACDSWPKVFLWPVLARYGVPEERFSVTRQLHGGVHARVRVDGANTRSGSEWNKGSTKEALPQLLCNVFFVWRFGRSTAF